MMNSSVAIFAVYTILLGIPGDSVASVRGIGNAGSTAWASGTDFQSRFSPLDSHDPVRPSGRSGCTIGTRPSHFSPDDLFAEESEGEETDPSESCGLFVLPVFDWGLENLAAQFAFPHSAVILADSMACSVLRC
jgi:hypothetical protein